MNLFSISTKEKTFYLYPRSPPSIILFIPKKEKTLTKFLYGYPISSKVKTNPSNLSIKISTNPPENQRNPSNLSIKVSTNPPNPFINFINNNRYERDADDEGPVFRANDINSKYVMEKWDVD